MAKWGAFVHPRRSEPASESELTAPGRIYRVIIVILVIDYPRTISAAPVAVYTPPGTPCLCSA